jgi:hypothetical protein
MENTALIKMNVIKWVTICFQILRMDIIRWKECLPPIHE